MSAGLGEDVAAVDVLPGGAQGLGEFGGQEGSPSQGDEDVVVASHEAHGA